MGAEAVVVGRVANGRGQWAAQGEVVVGEQAPPPDSAHGFLFQHHSRFAADVHAFLEEAE
jgi:hypothetical protein